MSHAGGLLCVVRVRAGKVESSSESLEERTSVDGQQSIADFERMFFGEAGIEFEDHRDRFGRCNARGRHRRRVRGDRRDHAVLSNERHVERYISVFHPHRDYCRLPIAKQHALIFVELLDAHQSLGLLRSTVGEVNADGQAR